MAKPLPEPIYEDGVMVGLRWDHRRRQGESGKGVRTFAGKSKRLSFRVPEQWAGALDYVAALTELGAFAGKSEAVTQTEIHRQVFYLGYKLFILREAIRLQERGAPIEEIADRLHIHPTYLQEELAALGLAENPEHEPSNIEPHAPGKPLSDLDDRMKDLINKALHG